MNQPPSPSILQLILLAAFLVPAIFFLLTQQNTVKLVKPENRLMQPGLVWLQLIPLLGLLWQFFVITRIAGSIKNELASWHNESIFGADAVAVEGGVKPTLGIGIAYAILNVCGLILGRTGDTGL